MPAIGSASLRAVLLVAAQVLLSVIGGSVLLLVGVRWRLRLARRLQQLYVQRMAFYRIQHRACDNPARGSQ